MRWPAVKCLVVSLVLGGYVFAMALAASPELHHVFNHDADNPGHQCAATVIASGQVDASPAAVVFLEAPAFVSLLARSSEPRPRTSADFWLLPERAPPMPLS